MSDCILPKVAAGRTGAVDECLSRYGGLVWSLARRQSPNQADAEDAVQEIFIDLWHSAARFDERVASEVTFVAMIARRRLIDRRRKLGRTVDTTALSPAVDPPTPPAGDPVAFQEEAARAREQLQQLKPDERKVIELAIDRGLSSSQIADQLDMPLGTVKTNARRGMIRLRELFVQSSRRPSPQGARR
jgi:RNA polymerase sigma-70 factor (ECF subfamily)